VQPSTVQSYQRFPLTHLLATAGHVRVLRALLSHGGPLSVSQVAADSGLSKRGARDALENLLAQRAVTAMGPARGQLFSADLKQPLVAALRELFEAERAHWESLQAKLREGLVAEKHIRSAWLYGSVAHGTDAPRSDLDLALALDEDTLEVVHKVRDAVQDLGDRLGVYISLVVLTPADLAKMSSADTWWSDVVRDAKVLKGSAPAKEAARAQAARAA